MTLKKGENEWLRDVIQTHKNKRISFKDICNLVESKEENMKIFIVIIRRCVIMFMEQICLLSG